MAISRARQLANFLSSGVEDQNLDALSELSVAVKDRIQVANTTLLVNDRIQVANAQLLAIQTAVALA
jgi:hypothetical protein